MKRVLLSSFLLATLWAGAQSSVQPVASGNYWEIDSYAARLPRLATKNNLSPCVELHQRLCRHPGVFG